MKRSFPYLILLALLVLVVAGCRQEPAPATQLPAAAAATEQPAASSNVEPSPDGGTASDAYPVPEAYPAPATDENGYPAPYGQVLVESGDSPTIDPALIITRELENPIPPDEPVPTPQPDQATVTGYVRSEVSGERIPAMIVRLAEVYRNDAGDAAFVLDGAQSPGTLTDLEGRFIFRNVEPREYVLIVGDVEANQYEAIAESPNVAKVWMAEAGQILDMGEVSVELE